MDTQLDWSAYDSYGDGDAYAALPATGGAFGKAAAVCIGNRQCQRSEKGVMCPSFRATGDEAHSTRHRAATLKAALNGEYGDKPFVGPELEAAMDLCVGCKGCKRECPNGVDMALLRVETMAQRWLAQGGVPLRERILANLPQLAPWMAALNGLMRLREKLPFVAQLAEKLFGIAAQRSLPKSAAWSFLGTAPHEAVGDTEGREVVLLVDTFSNHFDPETAQAALDVLVAGGYRVHIARPPAGQRLCCGRTYLSQGLVAEARAEALRMVETLWPYVEQGMPVIGLEPSCLLMLRDEYYALGLGDNTAAVAKAALLLEEFLAREHDAKRLKLDFQAMGGAQAVIHGHCHQKAFGALKPMRKVLGLIPELKVEFIESSCCGMAGSFGLEAEHYAMSMKMGELSLLPAVRAAAPEAWVVANGSSCRHQIRDGADRDSVHFARLLKSALAA